MVLCVHIHNIYIYIYIYIYIKSSIIPQRSKKIGYMLCHIIDSLEKNKWLPIEIIHQLSERQHTGQLFESPNNLDGYIMG